MKKIVMAILILSLLLLPVSASSRYLKDGADLLSSQQETDLQKRLEEISKDRGVDIRIITANTKYDYDRDYFSDDDEDYILLLVSVQEREWEVLTSGKGDDILDDEALDALAEEFLPSLSDGDYIDAFETFAEGCDEAIQKHTREMWIICIVGALLIGLIVALITTGVMRKKLKSVKYQRAAAGYVRPGSLQLTRVQDIFLYSHVSRIKKPDPPSNNNRSFSSGSFHGGRGGRF